MSLVYMLAYKIPMTWHLGMCTLGRLLMTEELDIWPVALIWPQSCCRVLYQFSASLPHHWESALSEAMLPINKWVKCSFLNGQHSGPSSFEIAESLIHAKNVTCYVNEINKSITQGAWEMLGWNLQRERSWKEGRKWLCCTKFMKCEF